MNEIEQILDAMAEAGLIKKIVVKHETIKQKPNNDNFDVCIELSKVITNLEFACTQLKEIRTKLSK